MRNFILFVTRVLPCFAVIAFGNNFLFVERAEAASCRGGGIGVHRTVTLNTSGGVRYGTSHGGARIFLRDKEVVLTFDDGPVPGITPKVLHELDKHCAKATFFMVGTMAKNHSSLARKVAAKGHSVGIHSYDHRNLGQLNGQAAISNVDRSITTIRKAVGRNVAPFFRFPYLSENQAVNRHLNRRGYGVFAIDVDSLDYKISSVNSMVNRVMSELRRKGKGIILLHDIQKVTANGIGTLLDRLDAEGYKLVHIRGRGGRAAPEPLLVSDAGNQDDKTSIRQTLLARNTKASTGDLRKRNAVRQRPKSPTAKKDRSGKKTRLASLSRSSKAARNKLLRKEVKKRILGSSVTPAKEKAKNKKRVKNSGVFAQNRAKALKVFKKNKQAFKSRKKTRLIMN